MPYKKSLYRKDFEERVRLLKAEAKKADGLGTGLHDARDMVFQCAIFQTSAALETYLKMIIESWFQQLKANGLGASLPASVRGRIAAQRLLPPFEAYVAKKEEGPIYNYLAAQADVWQIMTGNPLIPQHITGREIHDGRAYPSNKNLKLLFIRVGIQNIHNELAKILKRDIETLVEGFQSVRTAIAHSAPPNITLKDVRRLLGDIIDLVRALDRVVYRHVSRHGGETCWK